MVAAVARGGGLGLFDGHQPPDPEMTLAPFGIRVPSGARVDTRGAAVVLFEPGAPVVSSGALSIAQVRSLDEAAAALDGGAGGLVAMDDGDLSAFVLLQQLLEAYGTEVPVWASGVGQRTAVGAMAAGASGVFLDEQLRMLPDVDTSGPERERLFRTDSSLATLFARRYRDTEHAVRSLVAAVNERPRADGQGAPLCRTLGSTLPIAQGPMTRVSDQPAFAAEVADQGGFPFIAVATATGAGTTDLLDRTRDRLGDRAWGVGLLGFIDPALRDQQLAAVRAARPRCALLAGGKPAQAKVLEADGIPTYVHVPSPVLLRQFLDAGVRRFVFEGAECGGHIGPRPSFALWEQQLDVLRGSGPGIEVLFAGGVHDARSAAVVAGAAAELAAAGAGIGVLMGTAYLFTREAVTTGAITDLFQDLAINAGSTTILETAPGHRTRCLPSRYTAHFETVKNDLRSSPQLSAQQVWQQLEELNTGRLRIASKGLQHADGGPVAVDSDAQLSQGLYMAGQVAVLRDAKTTIAELHNSVTEGVADLLRSRPAEKPTLGRDIAIVGMACAFPGAPDLPAYWSQILSGNDAVTEVPADRWDTNVYGDLPRWGGFLPPLDFDPLAFGMPPSSMGSIDPAQLMSLELARRALADAGYAEREFDRDHTSVIFGAESGSDLGNAKIMRGLLPSYLDEVPPELLDQLPSLTEDSFPGTLANVISGRIANRLDLRGANYTVDAACGSSLAALDIAVKELRLGTSSMVLCGAVDLHNGVNDYLMFTSAGALSPTGRCRPFDAAADGIALGEGVACVVLKRLADAERDGDRVYAVIKGVGAASDGKALGLTAPRPEGQRRALERAYQDARSSPGDVCLVEAHGTGTVVGDATELRTLTDFFTDAGVAPGSIALGSVKSQIGHTKCAAGLAGLIKATLSLWHEVVPPTLHLKQPNAEWQCDTSPFTFSTSARPAPGLRGLAGVSAFGFGGTNFHAVLGPGPIPPDRRHGLRDWARELVLVRGSDVDSAREALRTLVEERPKAGLRELAEAATSVNANDPVRLAFVAENRESLTAGGISSPEPAGKIAFLFPGQGSQRPGMLGELFVHFPELADILRHAPAVVPAVFPPRAFDEDRLAAQLDAVTDTAVAQPALGLVESALCRLLAELGIRPDFLGGHSYGELVALSEAGAFTLSTLVELSRARARAIADASRDRPGAMAAVRATREVLSAELAGLDVSLANHNAPEQIIVSGSVDEIERCVRHLRTRRIATKRIAVSCAFHSPLVAPAEGAFATALDAAAIDDPALPVWSNTSARRYTPGAVRQVLAAQIPAPVRFVDQIEDMYAAGARTFVEVGPGQTLTRLVREILGDRPHTALPCGPGLREFLTTVGRLAVSGVSVDPTRLFRGRPPRTPPPPNAWTVSGHLVRRPDGQLPPHGLAPAHRIPRTAMTEATPAGRDQVVVEFLRNSRELITTQREVMLGYLGAVPAVRYAIPEVIEAPPRPTVNGAAHATTNGAAVGPAIANAVKIAPAPVAVVEAAADSAQPADVRAAVLDVISDRTGFPPDMIEGDLDLEADLSIDSIKRTEIAGTLLRHLGLADRAGDDGPDLLVRQRTANAITTQLEQWLRPEETATIPLDQVDNPLTGSAPRRYVLHLVGNPLPPPDPGRLSGKTLAVLSAPGQDELADSVRLAFGLPAAPETDADVIVSLHGLAESAEPAAPELFTQLKAAKGTFIAAATADSPGWPGCSAPRRWNGTPQPAWSSPTSRRPTSSSPRPWSTTGTPSCTTPPRAG